MNQIQAKLTAKLGPLPVYAWALLVLALVVGYMWFTKSGFFSPGNATSGNTGSSGDGSPSALGDAFPGGGLPVPTGSNSGADTHQGTNPVPSYYDPGSGGFVDNSSGSGLGSGDPTAALAVHYPGISSSGSTPIAGFGGLGAATGAAQPISGFGRLGALVAKALPTSSAPSSAGSGSGFTA